MKSLSAAIRLFTADLLNSFTQVNDITVLFSPAHFVYIIALKQTRNILDRCENLYAADHAI